MKKRPAQYRSTLLNLVRKMSASPDPYVRQPGKDFTRKRKLPFEKMILTLLSLRGGSLSKELMEAFHYDPAMPSSSAFIQQRNKILPSALEKLFHSYVHAVLPDERYKGFRLLAVDGSDLHVPTNADDPDSAMVTTGKPFNMLHLNAVYDLLSRTYTDALVQKVRDKNEHRAFCEMTDRAEGAPAILLADRGYESFNNMAHVQEKGWRFLFRCKDARGGIASGLELPDSEEFDLPLTLRLTRKQTNEAKALLRSRNDWRFIPSSSTFDYLPQKNCKAVEVPPYALSFRLVRFRLEDGRTETVVTNLDAGSFPPVELKKLYAMRWGIETSFRELKYTLGLLHFHAKKTESILQEIFASLIMYNFTEQIASHVIHRKFSRKYDCRVNFSAAVSICRRFFSKKMTPSDLEALLARCLTPIKPGRHFPRDLKPRSAVSFVYRIA